MGLILLEALLALILLVGIVWWTMFSGRKRGELKEPPTPSPADAPQAAPTAAPSAPSASAPPAPPAPPL